MEKVGGRRVYLAEVDVAGDGCASHEPPVWVLWWELILCVFISISSSNVKVMPQMEKVHTACEVLTKSCHAGRKNTKLAQ